MVQTEGREPLASPSGEGIAKSITPSEVGLVSSLPGAQHETGACSCGRPDGKCVCGSTEKKIAYFYIYALGQLEARFPRPSVEKEFAQVAGRAATTGLTDKEALHTVLSQRQNRYLARQMCWVFTIQGLETYILQPRDPADIDLLVEAIRPPPSPTDIDVVIGMKGPIAQPDICNGLMIPIVIFDQMYSFDIDTLIKSIPKPEKINENQFKKAAEELFWKVMQIAHNKGETDGHRAENYLAVRYHAIYAKTAEAFAANSSFTAVETRPSRLSGARNIVDVIFSFTNRQTDVTEKYFVRVDVTEEFPFLHTKLSPYFER
jgi:hypothetical protein